MKTRLSTATRTRVIAQLVNKHSDMALSADMSALLAFGEDFAFRLKAAMESFSRTRAYPPIGYAHQISRWGLCISDNNIDLADYDLSNPVDLDELHLTYLEWYFSNNPAIENCKFETLRRHWTNQGDFIRFCQNSKVLPFWDWYIFPKMRRAAPKEYSSDNSIDLVGLGEKGNHPDFYAKIAASKRLSLSVIEDIEALSDQLTANLERLSQAALKSIKEQISNFDAATKLANEADTTILSLLRPGDPLDRFTVEVEIPQSRSSHTTKEGVKRKATKYVSTTKLHLFSPSYKKGLNNLIWWVRTHYDGYIREENFSLNRLSRPEELDVIRHYPKQVIQKYTGVVTQRQLIPYLLLLFCRCQEISNLSPILRASIDDIKPINNGQIRLSVNKRRARATKSSLLDPETHFCIDFLKERTVRYRQELEIVSGTPCDLLFLGLKSDTYTGKPRPLSGVSSTGKLLKKFLKETPALSDLQEITFSSIRNTHAVIEYIQTGGDWHQVSRILGHSVQTAMRHYIPQQLTTLLRERKVRQHQNEMLIVASFGQQYDLLEAVDFETHKEVENFLTNILRIDNNRTDVLLSELDRKISIAQASPRSGNEDSSLTETAHIALSIQGLAALFKYEQHLVSSGDAGSVLKGNASHPEFWTALSSGLHALLGSPNYSNKEHVAIFKKARAIADAAS